MEADHGRYRYPGGLDLIQNPVEGTLIFGMTVVLILAIQGLIVGRHQPGRSLPGGWLGTWDYRQAFSIIFGILLLGNIGAATMVLPWVVGVFMIVGGIITIIMSFRLRSAA